MINYSFNIFYKKSSYFFISKFGNVKNHIHVVVIAMQFVSFNYVSIYVTNVKCHKMELNLHLHSHSHKPSPPFKHNFNLWYYVIA